jgi:undecaprenyl diphosphate synthase
MLLDVAHLPAHVAIVMDGTGRWAEARGLPRSEGHRAGAAAVRRTVTTCRELGVRALTLYALSAQSWERPVIEIDALMELLADVLRSERDELLDHRIRLRAIGSIAKLPRPVRELLDPLTEASARNEGMTLTVALSYGGREEIASAARSLAERVQREEIEVDAIGVAELERELPSSEPGPVDLLVRTGGEQRISNFLLWGSAYAELHFTSRLWPDFDTVDLFEALAAFQSRERRFGRVLNPEPRASEDRLHV